MKRTIIVDEYDHPIDLKLSDEVEYDDVYRVAALWVTDTTGTYSLIAQRKWNKRNDPGKWAAAVAGTVEEGETYEGNIEKETREEIGLTGVSFTFGPKQYVDDGSHKFFCQWFFLKLDMDSAEITIQEDEVEATKWIKNSDLAADITANPQIYTPSTADTLKLLGIDS